MNPPKGLKHENPNTVQEDNYIVAYSLEAVRSCASQLQ